MAAVSRQIRGTRTCRSLPFFVYGTLRDDDDTGTSYTRSFVKGAILPGESAYLRGAALFSLGRYPYLMFNGNDRNNVVWGRLIRFPERLLVRKLRMADEIEGTNTTTGEPEDDEGYYRTEVEVNVVNHSNTNEEKTVRAWVYSMKKHPPSLTGVHPISSGDWLKRQEG